MGTKQGVQLDLNQIKTLLPHRYPFLLVDRVDELVEGEHIVAYKNITANEEVFNGHFPGAPIFPGVMIVEAMAQAAGILGFASTKTTAEDGKLYLFAGIDNCRFKRQVVPGDKLVLRAEVLGVKRNIWRFGVKATVDGNIAAEATLLCAYRDRD